MDPAYAPALIELVAILAIVSLAYKFPKFLFFLSLAVALGFGSLFYPNNVTISSHIGTRTTINAAYFSPGAKHDVEVNNNVPIPAYHRQSQVFVEVIAAGLNPSNFKINFAKIPFVRHLSKYHLVGYDFVGIVKSVGSDKSCSGFKTGDKIYGMATGSIAEFATAMCSTVGHAPQNLSDEEIAGLPVVALTSLEAWRRGGLKQGMHVLVIGASGGCGIFGVTLGKVLGGHVTGVSSARNVDFVSSLGADRVVDYTSAAAMQAFIAEGQQFDIIYDTVSSFAPEDPDYEPSMRPLLKPGGRYIAINGHPMDWLRAVLDMAVSPLIGRPGVMQRKDYSLFLLHPTTEMLDTVAGYFDQGLLREAPIDSTFHLNQDEIYAAFDRIKGRRSVGKIVIMIRPERRVRPNLM